MRGVRGRREMTNDEWQNAGVASGTRRPNERLTTDAERLKCLGLDSRSSTLDHFRQHRGQAVGEWQAG
jgi:hypothetical protein